MSAPKVFVSHASEDKEHATDVRKKESEKYGPN